MQDLPHTYEVYATSAGDDAVHLGAENLPTLYTAPPAQFGGPGDRWSPETLMMGAVADCFIFTFKAIAAASNVEWQAMTCDVIGLLDKVDKVTRFTRVRIQAQLSVDDESKRDRAERLLHKAEQNCLVSNSLNAEVVLSAKVLVNHKRHNNIA